MGLAPMHLVMMTMFGSLWCANTAQLQVRSGAVFLVASALRRLVQQQQPQQHGQQPQQQHARVTEAAPTAQVAKGAVQAKASSAEAVSTLADLGKRLGAIAGSGGEEEICKYARAGLASVTAWLEGVEGVGGLEPACAAAVAGGLRALKDAA